MHPIHKHGSGMRSAERYDAKEAYNKKLSSKARMHYLENDIADHKGMSRYEEGMSRQASPLNNFKGGYHKVQHAKGEAHKNSISRESVAQERMNLNTENPIKNASCKYKK